jgi:uncharacterized Zn finger protein
MEIIAKCPKCGSPWLLKSDAADRRIKCCKCGKLFKVPRMDDVPKAARVIKQAKSTLFVDESGKTYG